MLGTEHDFHCLNRDISQNIYLLEAIIFIFCRFMRTLRTRGMKRRFGGWRCTFPLASWDWVYFLFWLSRQFHPSTALSTGESLASSRYDFRKCHATLIKYNGDVLSLIFLCHHFFYDVYRSSCLECKQNVEFNIFGH